MMPRRRVWSATFPWMALALIAASTAPASALAADTAADQVWFLENRDELIALYKHFHTHPELSYREAETARRVADELRKTGAEVTTGVGKLGVVAILKNGAGPKVLVRSDLDALPVTEETGLPYASRVRTTDSAGKEVGVMHACGHDIHMTCLVATARWLAAHKDRWRGTAMLIGQPAEEAIGGAEQMLADGLYTRFGKPDFALALHVTHEQETGKIGYTPGPALAGATAVDIVIRGKGGHGAAPHATVDPIVLAALAVLDFQTIVSREVDPVHSSVVTVGSIHGGTKHNIIPSEVKLQLTLRYYSDDVRDQLIDGLKRRINALAQGHRAPEPTLTVLEHTPPTINTPDLVSRVVPALEKALGSSNVERVEPVMGAEDFGLFSQGGVPIFMMRVGSIPPRRMAKSKSGGPAIPSLHSALYYPDPEPTIRTGLHAMTAAVCELLPPKPKP